jgi:hypothetical protein
MKIFDKGIKLNKLFSDLEDSRLTNGKKIIGGRQTDGRTGLMNSIGHIVSEICS